MSRANPMAAGLALAAAFAVLSAMPSTSVRAEPRTKPLSPLSDIGFDQKLGATVPLDLMFRDESGRAVRLGEYFGARPVILSLAYFDCPMLCGMSLQGLASSLKTLSFDAGKEFQVVTVSFNPRNTPEEARKKKATYLAEYGRAGADQGWHFLTGDEDSIRRLTAAVGFRYAWDEDQKQYAHGTGIVLLSAQGAVSRYFFGIDYAPKDLRLGLIESAQGKIGTLTDQLVLLCYHYDPHTGRYSVAAINSVRAGAVLTMLALGTFIVVMIRRERFQARNRLQGVS